MCFIDRVIDSLTCLWHKVLNIRLIIGGMLCHPFLVLISLETDIIYLFLGLFSLSVDGFGRATIMNLAFVINNI